MRTFLTSTGLATVFACGLAGAALASDIPKGDAAYAPPPRQEMNWSGLYVGGYVGAGSINNDVSIIGGLLDLNGIGGEGWTAGGLLGYNFQINRNWLVGVQGDVGTTGLDTEIVAGGGNVVDAQPGLTASGSVRLGYLPTPSTLVYAIGGYSFARYDVDLFGGAANFKQNYHGYHLGGGIETVLGHGFTSRVEYRYTHYSDESWGTGGFVDVTPTSHSVMFALSWSPWNMGSRPDAVDMGSWSGLYVGGYGGGGGVVSDISIPGFGSGHGNGIGGDGWLAGGLVGYNFQLNHNWVVGVQGDIGSTGMDTDASFLGTNFLNAHPGMTWSASARLGYLVSPSTLMYVLGGYSHADYKVSIGGSNFNQGYTGFHVGGGLETKLTHNLTARVEYRYTQYGGEDWGTGGFIDVKPSSNSAMLALSWQLGAR